MGAVRIVAVAEGKRYGDLPDVPTIAETLPGVIWDAWYGLLAPAGTPKAAIDRLNQATVRALKVPETIAKFRQQGAVPVGSTPEEFRSGSPSSWIGGARSCPRSVSSLND